MNCSKNIEREVITEFHCPHCRRFIRAEIRYLVQELADGEECSPHYFVEQYFCENCETNFRKPPGAPDNIGEIIVDRYLVEMSRGNETKVHIPSVQS